MAPPYTHAPLGSPRLIRLLKLNPARRPAFELSCEIIEASLDKLPPYQALSYAWESQQLGETALCDGKELHMTANCAAALRQIAFEAANVSISFDTPTRHVTVSAEIGIRQTVLWVDSLCIDQMSVEERNHQVTLMAEIYSKARNVIVWLGQGDGDTWRAMRVLSRLGRLARVLSRVAAREYEVQAEQRLSRLLEENFPDASENPHVLISQLDAEGGELLSAVFYQPWFGRLWTLQEIVFARNAIMKCGDASVPWSHAQALSDAVSSENPLTGFGDDADSFVRIKVVNAWRQFLRSGKTAHQTRYRFSQNHPLGPLNAVLDKVNAPGISSQFLRCCHLAAQDLRDKVYAQHAILRAAGVELALPDYNKPVAQIYEETVRSLIAHGSTLEILCFVSAKGASTETQALPSWVPDLSFASLAWIPDFSYVTKNSKAVYRFDDHGALYMSGIPLDRIAARSTAGSGVITTINPDTPVSERWLGLWATIQPLREVIHCALNKWDIGGNATETLCMVLLQEISMASKTKARLWPRLLSQFKTWTQALTSGALEWATESGTDDQNTSFDDIFSPLTTTVWDKQVAEAETIAFMRTYCQHLEQNPASKNIHFIALSKTEGNHVFATENKRLGMATAAVQEGDEVLLIAGLRLPMIARKVGGAYRLIGAAFVHGIMLGEAWDVCERLQREIKVV